MLWAAAALALPAGCGGSDGDTAGNGGAGASSGSGGSSASAGSGGVLDAGGNFGDGSAGTGTIALTGTLRDFHASHPDFEYVLGDDRGLVEQALGSDGKPVYAGGAGTSTTNGQEAFDQWFRDVPGVNESKSYTITLERTTGSVFTYDNQEFFPLDGELFGNEGLEHNYHFTYQIHTTFKYEGGERFKFTGDDDLFVFINGQLAIDLGGVHGAESDEADLDGLKGQLGITAGETYALDFFFAERHTTQSTFRIDTTIATFNQVN